MATYRASTGNDYWTVPEFGDPSGALIDGLAGTDTLGFDRLARSRFTIKKDAATGYILVDSVSGASSTFHLKLVNVEKLSFSNGFDVVNLVTMFGDTTPPLLSTISPVSGSTGIGVNANLTFTFNETIARGSGNLMLVDAGGAVIETYAAASSPRLTLSGTTLVVDPSLPLGYGKTYTLKIDSGAIKDTSGNSYAGLATYSFTTLQDTAPVAKAGSFTLQEDTMLNTTLPVATDAEAQVLSYQLQQPAAHGTVVVNKDGSFSYTPLADYVGSDSFIYTVSDGELSSAATVISLTVTNVIDYFNGTAGDDVLTGTMAADRFTGGGGNDMLTGGDGIDTAVYGGPRSSYQISAIDAGFRIADTTGGDGTDTLAGIERLQFSDGYIALDLDGDAGKVAKLLGAIFGKAMVANQVYAGIGLHYIELGYSYEQLAKLAYNVALGANHTNAQLVELLLGNITNGQATAADKAAFVAKLDAGTLTQEALAVIAADSTQNTANIDLVGLSQHGLKYLPFG